MNTYPLTVTNYRNTAAQPFKAMFNSLRLAQYLRILILAVLVALAGGQVCAGETATAVASVVAGSVVNITVLSGGAGYTNEPAVTISGGGGAGATARAFLNGDEVGVIIVLTAGSGYTSVPTVSVEPPTKEVRLGLRLVPELTVAGPAGAIREIQWSSSVHGPWSVWTNLTIGSDGTLLFDLSAGASTRYYRAISGPDGFVWIPPGTFVMGSPSDETGRASDEVQRTVTLTKGFWMSDHEVTQAEYLAVMGSSPGYFKGSTLPVEQVSRYQADTYCTKLTSLQRAGGRIATNQVYRLPTEAEWEYAARAGTTGPQYGETNSIAWWSGNAGLITHPVKEKLPNAWGLYDMLGNVAEWCRDIYGSYPPGTVTDPTGPVTGDGYVFRGGNFTSATTSLRAAKRNNNYPDFRGSSYGLGFRPVLIRN